MNALNSFWSILDLSDNLQKAISSIRSIRGLPALLLAIAMAILSFVFFWATWYLDITSTLGWTQSAVDVIAPSIPPRFASHLVYLVLALTVAPTIVELFTARFAMAGIVFFGVLIFVLSLLDMVTDWPRVVLLLEGYRGAFDRFDIFAAPLFHLTRFAMLFMASFGFEQLFVVSSVVSLALFLQAGIGGRTVHAQRGVR